MSRKREKVCTNLNYIEHFLILASTITGSVSISNFASLYGIPTGIMNFAIGTRITGFAIGTKNCAIATRIKMHKSIIKKKKKKHDKIALLEKSKLNNIEILISKA